VKVILCFLGLKTGTVSTMVFYWFCDGMRVIKGFNLSSIIAGSLEETREFYSKVLALKRSGKK
jgi:hypothetical protein